MPEKCPGHMCREAGENANEATPDKHTCPYAVEINDNHEAACECCQRCEQECADDI